MRKNIDVLHLIVEYLHYNVTLPVDGQGRPKDVARFVTSKPYVSIVKTKLNKVALKAELNDRVITQIQQDAEIKY
jgi:hypothetical protein